MLEFYNKHKQFSDAVDDDWRRHAAKFVSVADEYVTDEKHDFHIFFPRLNRPAKPGSFTKNLKYQE